MPEGFKEIEYYKIPVPQQKPQGTIVRETEGYGQRVEFRNIFDYTSFVAEHYPKHNLLNLYWPSGNSLERFKKFVEETEENVEWDGIDTDGVARAYWGKVGNLQYWWIKGGEKYAPSWVGVQMKNSGISNIDMDTLLEKITKIASKTFPSRLKPPENLLEELKNFTASSLKQIPQ